MHCPDRLDGELVRGPAGKRADWIDTLHFYAVKVGGKLPIPALMRWASRDRCCTSILTRT